jgi:hypothetical protein
MPFTMSISAPTTRASTKPGQSAIIIAQSCTFLTLGQIGIRRAWLWQVPTRAGNGLPATARSSPGPVHPRASGGEAVHRPDIRFHPRASGERACSRSPEFMASGRERRLRSAATLRLDTAQEPRLAVKSFHRGL